MAPPAIPAGLLRWKITGGLGNANWEIGFWLRASTQIDPSEDELHAVLADLNDELVDFIPDACGDDVVCGLSRLTWYGLIGSRHREEYLQINGGRGSVTAAAVAACASWVVPGAKRGIVGRTFIPGPALSAADRGTVFDAFTLSAMQSAIVSLANGMTSTPDWMGHNLDVGILHRRQGGHVLDPPMFMHMEDPIVRATFSSQVQRGRRLHVHP